SWCPSQTDGWARRQSPPERRGSSLQSDVAAGAGAAFLCLQRVSCALDRQLSPYVTRLAARPDESALTGGHPSDDVSGFGGKRLRALDSGNETLELGNLLEVAIGITERNSYKSGGEGCAVPAAAPHHVGAGEHGGALEIGARKRARSAGSEVGDGSHA